MTTIVCAACGHGPLFADFSYQDGRFKRYRRSCGCGLIVGPQTITINAHPLVDLR